MTDITLTTGQQNALDAFLKFLTDPTETVFVLSGYSGTGKSTLVKTLLDRLPKLMKTAKLVNPQQKEYEVVLTATTNKAVENFASITGNEASTIHSFLELRVQTDYKTGVTKLIPRRADPKYQKLLFIDEASYIDKELLGLIFSRVKDSKIVFMGDPAQLTPVKSTTTPVFDANFSGAQLTEVVRQAKGNPIVELSTLFRETVKTGQFFSFQPDGHYIQHLSRDDFNKAMEAEFTRPDWRYKHSKFLAWTNQCVINHNHYIRDLVKGDPQFAVDDYAVCNKFIQVGQRSFKTDQLVQITHISPDVERHGVRGKVYTLDHSIQVFGPNVLADKLEFIKQARASNQISKVVDAENWIDLRAAYAQTINKSQGSTYGKVFIDLSDISRCNHGEQIARMLYVGISRAREQVIFTGDFV